MGKKPKTDAVKSEEPKGTQAKVPVAKAGENEAVIRPAEVLQTVVDAVPKPRKPRFVREQKEKRPQANSAPLPQRSTKASAKLMTKGMTMPPKEEKATGQKPKGW